MLRTDRIALTLAAALVAASSSFAAPVATPAEGLPASSPPACDYTSHYDRQSRWERWDFYPELEGGYYSDQRVVCAAAGSCPNYNSELAAHCALLQSFGGDCSVYPLTLAQLKTWPIAMDHNMYEAAVGIEVYEQVPHTPTGSVKWSPTASKNQWDNSCQSAGCIRVKMWETNKNNWPAAITAAELACLKSTTTPPVIIRTLGCLAPETRVVLEDGESRRAEEIKRGDRLWNPVLRRGSVVLGVTRGPENIPVIEITAGGRMLKVTEHHPMVLAEAPAQTDAGLPVRFRDVSLLDSKAAEDGIDPRTVPARTLAAGDVLRLADGSAAPIEKIRRVPLEGKRLVYNFLLEGESPQSHYFVAEGMVTGDLRLQNLLTRKFGRGI